MAEALGIVSSTITIWDLVCKLRKCHKRIKAAPAVWTEYCDKLESLSHVQSVLKDMMSGETSAFNGIKSKELATLAAKEIEIVGEQVNNILRSCDELGKSSRKRIWDWLRVKAASVKFVIAEEVLQGLIESAEKVKMSLQSAICLCGLETVNAGQTKMQEAFQILYDSMKEQEKALERLNRDKRLSKIPFSLVHKEEIPIKRPLQKEKRADTSRSESKRSSRRRKKRRSFDRPGQSRTKARYDEDQNLKVTEGYEIVLRNNDVLIMATDTDEYKSAADGNGTVTRSAGLEQIERKLESLSNDEWERGMGNHLYQFQLSPALRSENTLNTDLGNDTIPIIIDADKQNRGFVGETTDLDQCVYNETESMLFCVTCICMTDTGQTFAIREPCERPCRHVQLQIMNKWLKAKKLPCMMAFQSMACGVFSDETDEIQPASSFTLECYYKCPHRKPCSHTILESNVSLQEGRARQMIVADSHRLKAWPDDSEQEPALALFEMVQRGDDNIPARISFDSLVEYLKLIERLQLNSVHLCQCHMWTDAIISEVSTSFDEKAIAWTWLFWKLQRGPEFKTLTAIIQQQGKHSVGEETNQHGVNLPQYAIDAINRKRISVLSQIRDLVQHHIATCRVNYLVARTEDDPDWGTPLQIMRSSLTAGYLTLEYEMFLLNGQMENEGDFDGVSFSDALAWVGSMMNLGEWEVRTVPPAHRMPFVLSGLVALVPLVGVGLHEAGISAGFSSDVYESLNDLVRRLKEEDDWGIDLPGYED